VTKRRTRKQWYLYHLAKAQDLEQQKAVAAFEPILRDAQSELVGLKSRLASARSLESFDSRLLALLGIHTDYHRNAVLPVQRALIDQHVRTDAIVRRRVEELARARERGAAEYRAAHAARKLERSAQAQRAAERRLQRRIKYLEISTSIRAAARALKRLILGRVAVGAGCVSCFYCGIEVVPAATHLDHKKPIVRGGTNAMTNLVLSCAKCNLSKGRQTHEEYLASRITV
jgi:5-methylcytosine-specific restriction endonuclease McrA